MASWTLDEPDKITFDQVHRVLVRIVEGAVSVVGSDDRPTLEVAELAGAPLQVRHQAGTWSSNMSAPGVPGRWAGWSAGGSGAGPCCRWPCPATAGSSCGPSRPA
jgi:hypothetical protein